MTLDTLDTNGALSTERLEEKMKENNKTYADIDKVINGNMLKLISKQNYLPIPKNVLNKIAAELNCSVNYLILKEDNKEPVSSVPLYISRPKAYVKHDFDTDRIADRIKELGWKQTTLHHFIDEGKTTLQNILHGKDTVMKSVSYIAQVNMSWYLQCSVDYLRGLEDLQESKYETEYQLLKQTILLYPNYFRKIPLYKLNNVAKKCGMPKFMMTIFRQRRFAVTPEFADKLCNELSKELKTDVSLNMIGSDLRKKKTPVEQNKQQIINNTVITSKEFKEAFISAGIKPDTSANIKLEPEVPSKLEKSIGKLIHTDKVDNNTSRKQSDINILFNIINLLNPEELENLSEYCSAMAKAKQARDKFF